MLDKQDPISGATYFNQISLSIITDPAGVGNKRRARYKLAVELRQDCFAFKKAAPAKQGKKRWRNELRHLPWA